MFFQRAAVGEIHLLKSAVELFGAEVHSRVVSPKVVL